MQKDQTTILVADDQPDMLLGLKEILQKGGHKVIAAERGDKALELLRENEVDLVISDNQMPGPTGLQVLEARAKGIPRHSLHHHHRLRQH